MTKLRSVHVPAAQTNRRTPTLEERVAMVRAFYGVPRRQVDTSRNWKSPVVRVVEMAA
jgi:hypothetical protein